MHRPNALKCIQSEHEPFMKIAIFINFKIYPIDILWYMYIDNDIELQGIFTLMPVAYFQFYSPPLSPHDLRNYRGPPAVNHWPTLESPMDSALEMEPDSSLTPNSTGGRRRLWPGSYMDSPGPYPMYCLAHQVQRKDWTFVTFRKCLLNFFFWADVHGLFLKCSIFPFPCNFVCSILMMQSQKINTGRSLFGILTCTCKHPHTIDSWLNARELISA